MAPRDLNLKTGNWAFFLFFALYPSPAFLSVVNSLRCDLRHMHAYLRSHAVTSVCLSRRAGWGVCLFMVLATHSWAGSSVTGFGAEKPSDSLALMSWFLPSFE